MPDSNPSFLGLLDLEVGRGSCRSPRREVSARWAALAWSLGLALLSTTGRSATFTVGTAGPCTHAGLQAALAAAAANGPGQDEIRLSADQVGSFSIADQSVSVIGGYADCAASTPTGTTLLSGPGGARVLDIQGGSGSLRTTDLAHLEITGGAAAFGAGIQIGGAAYVTLEDTSVYGNVATQSGGGIFVQGHYGAVLILDQGSSVMSNSAANVASGQGGGIDCFEDAPANAYVGLFDALVYDNQAGVDGGGLYLSGCDLTSYSGGALRGVVANRALRGGGVFAKGGSLLKFYGGSQHPATLDSNVSTATPVSPGWPFGSAARIEGAGTRLELHDSWVVGNSGSFAVVATGADGVVIDRTLGVHCHDPLRCSRVSGNSCGGLQILDTALTVRETWLEENGPDCPVVTVDAGGRTALIEGSVFARNHFDSTRPRIISVDSGQTRIAYSTFVDNLTDATGWTQYVLGLDLTGGAAHDLVFVGNLVAETAGLLVDTFGSPAMWDQYDELFDCLIVHEGSSLPPVSTATQVLPGSSLYFVDRAGHDYHLRDATAAIDVCDTLNYSPGRDLDFLSRAFDDPAVSNWYGPYDLGADEFGILFADGFETGGTRLWWSAAP